MTTPGALAALERRGVSAMSLLQRHQNGDWGVLPAEDRRENELSVKEGFRILSSYPIAGEERIWVITEADRSVTILLLPESIEVLDHIIVGHYRYFSFKEAGKL